MHLCVPVVVLRTIGCITYGVVHALLPGWIMYCAVQCIAPWEYLLRVLLGALGASPHPLVVVKRFECKTSLFWDARMCV